MTWAIINITAGVIVAALVAYLLGSYGPRFNMLERMGSGMIGGSMLLTVGPLLGRGVLKEASPFDDWSGTLLRVGLAVFFVGIVGRLEGYIPGKRLSPPPTDWEGFVDKLDDIREKRK